MSKSTELESCAVKKGRRVFNELCRNGEKVNKSKVARLAGFSKSNLFSDKNDVYKNAAWQSLAEDIGTLSNKGTKGQTRNKLDEVRLARDDNIRKYNAQVKDNTEILGLKVEWEHEKNYHKQQFDIISMANTKLKVQVRSYQNAFEQQTSKNTISSNISMLHQVVISPDEEMLRINGGDYAYGDSRIQRAAHRAAQAKLAQSLSETKVAIRLYVLLGRPGSGKTFWVDHHKPPHDRFPVYYDATNADAGERMDILDIATTNNDCVVCFVYMATSIERCIRQNALRANKVISDNVIENFNIEEPRLDELFDELIIVRKG